MKPMSKIELQRHIVRNGNNENSINHFIDTYYKEDLENTDNINLKQLYVSRIDKLKDQIKIILPDFKKNIKKFDKIIDRFNNSISEETIKE